MCTRGASGGRFSWASLSDYIGRKNTYFVYMVLGFALYVTVPYAGASGNVALFVICFLIIVSMYGGGFSTVPAYLRDMFGTRMSAPSTASCSRHGPPPASQDRC